MSQPKSRRKNRIEPLDWKELADAPALRGLEEALTPMRELQDNGRDVGLRLVHDGARIPVALTEGVSPTVGVTPTVGVSPTVGGSPPLAVTPPMEMVADIGYEPDVVITPPSRDRHLGTVGLPATVGVTPTVGVSIWVDRDGNMWDPKRVRTVTLAQHSMTQGERILYEALWHCRETHGLGKFKTFSLGYDRIAHIASVDEKTVRVSVPRLISKRVLDLVAGENSATRTGRTYRIYSYEGILERQRAAGMTSVIKNGKAVEFVWRSGTAGVAPTVGVPVAAHRRPVATVAPTVGVPPTVGGTPVGRDAGSHTDLATFRLLAGIVQEKFGSPVDDLVLRSLIDNCHRNSIATIGAPASQDALVYFVSTKASEICRQPSALFPKKVLAKSVAECFLGETYRVYVENAIARQQEETQRAARQAQDSNLRAQEMAEQEARHAHWTQICENHKTEQGYDMKAIAEDLDLDQKGREVAREIVRRVGRFSGTGL